MSPIKNPLPYSAAFLPSEFWTVPVVKILNFKTSKILETIKSQYLSNGLTDRHEIWKDERWSILTIFSLKAVKISNA